MKGLVRERREQDCVCRLVLVNKASRFENYRFRIWFRDNCSSHGRDLLPSCIDVVLLNGTGAFQ